MRKSSPVFSCRKASQPQRKEISVSTTPVPEPAPAPKSGGALKIILIVLGVIALLVVLVVGVLVYGCYRIAHSIVETSKGGATTLHTLGGAYTAANSSSFTASDLGTAIYPGATPTDGGSKMDMPTATIVTGVYLTSDPVSKVEAFYKDKFGSGASDFNMGGTAMITDKVSDKETILVTVTTTSGDNGKTKILLQHTKTK
jgi:hypothetical protein